ncbi:LysE family transporter [Alcaligenaceae bacterium]|nr:LysE family transporter [Alcaligenaceae bacterium]
MTLDTWLIYLMAALALSVAPGPNGLLALTNGALYGLRKTLFGVSGGAVGFTLVIGLSMMGIGALLQASASMLAVLKWVGGAYLIWLGIQVWRSPAPNTDASTQPGARHGMALFRQGFLSAVSNPKAILFFGAFLSQFIDPQRSLLLQFAIMSATFVVVEIITELLIASLAFRIRHWLKRSGRRFNQVCGGFFMLIGGWLPLSR